MACTVLAQLKTKSNSWPKTRRQTPPERVKIEPQPLSWVMVALTYSLEPSETAIWITAIAMKNLYLQGRKYRALARHQEPKGSRSEAPKGHRSLPLTLIKDKLRKTTESKDVALLVPWMLTVALVSSAALQPHPWQALAGRRLASQL